jgi:MFS family permease
VLPPLLRENASFRRFFVGQSVSLVGDQVSAIALPLTAVLALGAGATRMSILTTAYLLPNLLFSLHAGVWIDRRGRRRRAMLAADAGRALLVATVPVAYALGHLTFAQLVAVAFATGTLSVLFFVAYGSLFQAVVPRDRYLEGNALLNGARATSATGGPALGGALVQVLRAPYALAADAVSFAASAAALARMDVEEPPPATRAESGLGTGLRWIADHPVMRPYLAAVATINYFNFVFFALFVLYATRSLHVAPGALGLVLGAGAIGGVAGSMLAGRVVRRLGLGASFALGCVLFPAPIVLVPAAGGPHRLVLACLFAAELGSGFGVMILDIAGGTITAGIVPPALRARVSGAFMAVNYGVRPLGTVSAGVLAGLVGVRPTLWIATIASVAGILWLVPSPIWSLREIPVPEAE